MRVLAPEIELIERAALGDPERVMRKQGDAAPADLAHERRERAEVLGVVGEGKRRGVPPHAAAAGVAAIRTSVVSLVSLAAMK